MGKEGKGKEKGNAQQRNSCGWLLTTATVCEGKALPTASGKPAFPSPALWVSLRPKAGAAGAILWGRQVLRHPLLRRLQTWPRPRVGLWRGSDRRF